MKRLLILFLFVSVITGGYAQRRGSTINWLSLALKGGYGNTIMFNNDIMNDVNISQNYAAPSYAYGIRFGITHGDYVGISAEYLWSGFSQKYDIKRGTELYSRETKFVSTDILGLFRFTSDYGFYLELGPKFTTITQVSQTSDIVLPDPSFDTNVKDNYVTKFNSGVLGMGFMPMRTERLTLSLGIRAAYSLNSIVANQSYFPVRDGYYTPVNVYSDATTNPLTLQLMAEFNYFFGFWGDASCGRGRLMFFQ